MPNHSMLSSLNDEQRLAVDRFRMLHNSEARDGGEHHLTWMIDDEHGGISLVCGCGATLHVDEPIFVSVEPRQLSWDDDVLAKKIAEEIVAAAVDPKHNLFFEPTPAGFFTYLYGIGRVFELANMDIFPNGFPQKTMRRFIDEICGTGRKDRGFDLAMKECESDDVAFATLARILPELIAESAPATFQIDFGAKKNWRWRRTHNEWTKCKAEALYQSALVTLPDDTLEQVRLHPSRSEMHFGLGLYLRNRFVHSGLIPDGLADELSGAALSMLIRRCIPELKEHELIYGQIDHGVLYDAYRFCMEVRGELPKRELIANYDILLEAKALDDANPYSISDRSQSKDWRKWSDSACEKRRAYDNATLHEIWNFEKVRADLGEEAACICEKACLAAANAENPAFLPSEIAYALAGSTEVSHLAALDWAAKDYAAAPFIPASLFDMRALVLRAVSKNGRLLEYASKYQDDDEAVLAAVSEDPTAVRFASPRLQNDRRVLVAAARNAEYALIFSDGPMAKHNDDDELVRLAIMANGANIEDASDRLRDDVNFGLLAVQNKRDFYPDSSYEGLSDRLKHDRRIVEEVARSWPFMPNEFPPREYADDDAIAALLSTKEDRFSLFGLSRRLKERYMTPDELERWGDDPWWWSEDEEVCDDDEPSD